MANPRIDDLRKRLEKEPGSRLFAQLAEELRKDGDLQEAIRVCREGLQKQPNYPSARMTLGRALFDSGDLQGARSELEGALKGAPDNILAGRLLGECLERQGDRVGALARFKATLALAAGDRQIVERIQALEAGPAAEPATIVMPPRYAPAPAPPMAAGIEATLVDVPSPMEAEDAAVSAVLEADPAPIPLAHVESEVFELERPYEVPPTVIGTAAPPAAPAPAAAEPVLAPEPFPESPAPRLGAPEPLAAQPSAAAPELAADAELNTVTLAELYLSQGVMDKAMEVYRQVLERDPHNARARARLSEIEALDSRIRAEQALGPAGGAADSESGRREAIERTIAKLEGLLSALRRE